MNYWLNFETRRSVLNESRSRYCSAHRGVHHVARRFACYEIVELSVADLGFSRGVSGIGQNAKTGLGHLVWHYALFELAPHLRLQYLDQPEGYIGYPPSEHRAPPGSLTVASRELASDDEIPKGFYLRRIEGVLWLRGYCSGPDHVWSAADRFVFCRPQAAA